MRAIILNTIFSISPIFFYFAVKPKFSNDDEFDPEIFCFYSCSYGSNIYFVNPIKISSACSSFNFRCVFVVNYSRVFPTCRIKNLPPVVRFTSVTVTNPQFRKQDITIYIYYVKKLIAFAPLSLHELYEMSLSNRSLSFLPLLTLLLLSV